MVAKRKTTTKAKVKTTKAGKTTTKRKVGTKKTTRSKK